MRPLSEYAEDAARLSLEDFTELHGRYFLVKQPAPIDVVKGEDFEFHTDHGPPSKIIRERGKAASSPMSGSEVVPVRKKPGNPWPKMISVGRTRACDITLRYPNISKLHAILRLDDGDALELIDQGSANGTTLNDLPVAAAMRLKVGDRVSFGGIECDLLDAAGLIEQVRAVHG